MRSKVQAELLQNLLVKAIRVRFYTRYISLHRTNAFFSFLLNFKFKEQSFVALAHGSNHLICDVRRPRYQIIKKMDIAAVVN